SIEVSYSDGEWRLPWEFHRENHPHHRGYGMLHHSGYHFVDLIARLTALNDTLGAAPDTVEVRVGSSRQRDFLVQIPLDRYAHLLNAPAQLPATTEASGEIDLWAQLRFLRDGCLVTTATLNL